MTISRWILLTMRNVSDKSCTQNQNTHFMFNNFSQNRAVWDNVEKYGTAGQATDDNIIRRMRFACWITKATDTHSEYVILIAFPRQQRLCERAWLLRYTYIACLLVFMTSPTPPLTRQCFPPWTCSPVSLLVQTVEAAYLTAVHSRMRSELCGHHDMLAGCIMPWRGRVKGPASGIQGRHVLLHCAVPYRLASKAEACVNKTALTDPLCYKHLLTAQG